MKILRLKRGMWQGFTLLFILGTFSLSFAQSESKISGIVYADDNEPLIGATITEQGTTKGVFSKMDGTFELTVSNQNANIVVSYIGFETQIVPLNGRTKIEVNLVSNQSTLNEIVVVGYNSVKKKDLTGAVNQIDAEKLVTQSPNSVTDVLRAQAPGLSVGFNAGPKGVSNLQIRGSNSLSATTSPLIVVDGMIYNGDLADINQDDIAKIDVMKDASSAAVYGARGANGVILITTKRGSSDKPIISLSTSVGIASIAKEQPVYSPDGYVKWRTDVFKSINADHTNFPGRYDNPNSLPAGVTLAQWLAYDNSSGDPVDVWLNRIGFKQVEINNYKAGKSLDFPDLIFQNGFRNDVNVSISGQNKGINYYYSLGNTSNEGIIKGEKFTNFRSRLNLEAKITNWLDAGINAQFARRNEGFIPASWTQIYLSSPWGSLYNDDGTVRLSPQDDSPTGAFNPFLGQLFNDRVDLYHTLNTRMFGKVKLPFGINYELGFSNRYEFNEYYNHSSSLNPQNNGIGTATRQFTKLQEWQLENIFRWNKSFGPHNLDATFLVYAEKYQSFFTNTSATLFDPSDILGYHLMQSGTVQKVQSNDVQSTGDALMGRLNYSFKSKYIITLTGRRDGYSAFGVNNKRAFFPSVALAWNISQESFFHSDWLTYLKLRLSYGENGNRNIGIYSSLSQLASGKTLITNAAGAVVQVSTINNTTQENSDLKWERTKAYNIGLDYNLWNGKVEGSIEAYKQITTDLIVQRQLPNIIGFSQVITNLGEVQNTGLEFIATSHNLSTPNLKWNTTFNFALNRNKIVELYGDKDENGKELDDVTNAWFIGQPIDVIWGLTTNGIYQVADAEEAAKYGVKPGDFRVVDQNGDGLYTLDDNVYLGYRKPRFTWAMTNSFNFLKNFDFSFELYAQLGQSRNFNLAKNNAGFVDRTSYYILPYWTPENPINDYARLYSSSGNANYSIYRKSSFVRLNNITLSYGVPSAKLKFLGINSLRVYANVRNAAVFSKWKFFDPELSTVDGVNSNGAALGPSPSPRYFTLGLNLSI